LFTFTTQAVAVPVFLLNSIAICIKTTAGKITTSHKFVWIIYQKFVIGDHMLISGQESMDFVGQVIFDIAILN